MMKENLIKKLYYNELDLMQYIPETTEYKDIVKKMAELTNQILNKSEEEVYLIFNNYLELINAKEAIEAESQFQLGFKTAIKIIIQGLE